MKEVTIDTLKSAANRLMLEMPEEQYVTLLEEFHVMLKQMELIGEIDGVDDVEPMTFPFGCVHTFLREDEPHNQLTREEGLRNAPDVLDNQIKLPKVVK